MRSALALWHSNAAAGRDEPAFAVARGDLHPCVEVDDVLPPRGRMPIDIVLGLGLAKDDTGRRQLSRQFAAPPLLGPFDLNIAEMRLAVGVGVKIMDPHLFLPKGPLTRRRAPSPAHRRRRA